MDKTITIEAAAKINLALDIVGKRPDGYHDMRMINHSCMLADRITLVPDGAYSLDCDSAGLDTGENNLVTRAVRLMERESGKTADFKLVLEKHIPEQAGLAGGSADAAAVLKLLNEYWELNLTTAELAQLGTCLGADIPYCVTGGTALVEGIGEQITPLDPGRPEDLPGWLLIVKPGVSVPTPQAFAAADKQGLYHPDIRGLVTTVRDGAYDRLAEFGGNSFFPAVSGRYPEIAEIRQELLDRGAQYAVMSGSGSSVVGYFPEETIRDRVWEQLTGLYGSYLIIRTEYR
ncbi:MAG: 4-(cytidine 5'-diphospho)-2-C-methyl-D-erythritol kinase [Eubacteriaceae bacterium]|jgi:4-diphosphocytidyl-2-C-methyl-D-erythritol kinase